MLRRKTTAARSPALTPVAGSTPAAAAPAVPAATIESLGQQLREILPTRRLHSVSLCDHEANVLWLSEGALGPDEHSLVVEALELLSVDLTIQCHEMAVEDGRLALFLPVRAPSGVLVGIAMVLGDIKSLGDDTLERLAAGPVRAIMLRLAVLLKPNDDRAVNGAVPAAEMDDALDLIPEGPAATAPPEPKPAQVISAEEVNEILEFELTPADTMANIPVVSAAAVQRVPTAETSSEMMSLEFINDTPLSLRTPAPPPAAAPTQAPAQPPAAARAPARPAPAAVPVQASPIAAAASAPTPSQRSAPAARMPEPPVRAPAAPSPATTPATAPAPAASAAAAAAAGDPSLLLEILPFARLRPGGQSRRFQVLARPSQAQRDPAALDALVLQRLMTWLAAHRSAWNSQPTAFTVNLSIATLEDDRFVHKTAAALNAHGIAAETVGFEVAEALCTQRRAQVERFITQCEKVGSWVVIDDFSFDSAVLPLLRSRAMRLVKIDPKLTSSALKDKLCQAVVVATVQAAKVLGIHCAAKKVDSQAALQWLTAIGCDFAQGAAIAQVQSLDSLSSSPDPTGLTAHVRPS